MNKKILCIGFIVIAVIISLSAVSGGLFDRDNGEVQDQCRQFKKFYFS